MSGGGARDTAGRTDSLPDHEPGKTTPCPLREEAEERSITGRFNPAEVKCGNHTGLDAEAVNVPDGTEAVFTLKAMRGHAGVGSESQALDGSQVRGLQWISKKTDDQWGEPDVFFSVAAGVSNESENQLSFIQYPDVASQNVTFNRTATNTTVTPPRTYRWTGKYDIEFTGGEIIITTKIKLINRLGSRPSSSSASLPGIGPAVSETDKAAMKSDIESKLTEKWILHRDDCQRGSSCDCPNERKCCKFKVIVVVDFVEAGEHHRVNLFQGSGRASATNWTRDKTRDNSWAHETGHLLGWYDEYPTGATGPAPRWQTARSGAIMRRGLAVPNEYYWDFRDWLQSAASENWELIAP